ncbi:hypothetical protein ACWDX5_31120, partial [Streptomyces tuirus]
MPRLPGLICGAAHGAAAGPGGSPGGHERGWTGRDIAARDERVALLVMGDASACRTVKAPGY